MFFGGGWFFICPCLLSRLWYWVSDLELCWWSISLLIGEFLSQSSKSHGSYAKDIGHSWWLLFGSLVLFGGCCSWWPLAFRGWMGFCQVLRARQRSMRAKLKAGRLDKKKNQLHKINLWTSNHHMDVSENSGFSPQIIHFNRVFPL